MKMPKLKIILLTPVILFVIIYVALATLIVTRDETVPAAKGRLQNLETIAILGASGTAGDGILKAAMANPDVKKIHVITRRSTPRIEEGIASGKVQMSQHMDYLDYATIREQIAGVDAVFWAIGISSIGVDADTYRKIHVDFPRQFVQQWLAASTRSDISFHFISSSDLSEDSTAMWVQVKIESEHVLFAIADNTRLRVIAFRPDYIGATSEEAHIGQQLLYAFFSPIGVAVKATQIGQAMMEVAARGDEFANGATLSNRRIIEYSDAYEQSGNLNR